MQLAVFHQIENCPSQIVLQRLLPKEKAGARIKGCSRLYSRLRLKSSRFLLLRYVKHPGEHKRRERKRKGSSVHHRVKTSCDHENEYGGIIRPVAKGCQGKNKSRTKLSNLVCPWLWRTIFFGTCPPFLPSPVLYGIIHSEFVDGC